MRAGTTELRIASANTVTPNVSQTATPDRNRR